MKARPLLLAVAILLSIGIACNLSNKRLSDGNSRRHRATSTNQSHEIQPQKPDYSARLDAKIANDSALAEYKQRVDSWVERWQKEKPTDDYHSDYEREMWSQFNITVVHSPPDREVSNDDKYIANSREDIEIWNRAIAQLQPYIQQKDFEMIDVYFVRDTYTGGKNIRADFLAKPLSKDYGSNDVENKITLEFHKLEGIVYLESIYYWTDMEYNHRRDEIRAGTDLAHIQLREALDRAKKDCGFYPDRLQYLTLGKDSFGDNAPDGWRGPYLEEIPGNPSAGELFGKPVDRWGYDPTTGKVTP